MMIKLLKKEIRLCMHPTAILVLLLSAMMLIPNYPYYVCFFYNGLAVFFTCLSGRENNDILYSMMLPVAKRDVVTARYLFVVLLQLAQVALAIPFAILRQQMPLPGNQAGMDANIALFGLSLVMLALFNVIFFNIYYKDVHRVGVAFVWSCVGVFLFILVAETCTHVVPFMRDVLDTPDPEHLVPKLIVLAAGAAIYATATYLSYRRSVKNFEVLDL